MQSQWQKYALENEQKLKRHDSELSIQQQQNALTQHHLLWDELSFERKNEVMEKGRNSNLYAHCSVVLTD